jgi:hypothetical protein
LLRAWRDPGAPGRDVQFALAGGILAFLITCLAGHPFLTGEVMWSFFLSLGVVAGLGPADLDVSRSVWPRRLGPFLFALVLALAPVRAWQLLNTDLHRSTIGAGPRIDAEAEPPYRLAAERSTWFVPPLARLVVLPLRLTAESPASCRVEIRLDGAVANAVAVTNATWQAVPMQLLPGSDTSRARRIELRVEAADCHLMVGDLRIRQ